MSELEVIDEVLLDRLSLAARHNERLRRHHNLHQDADDPFQRMVVAIEPGSYIRPHRHQITPKPENVIGLRGRIGVVTFDDAGSMLRAVEIAPGQVALGVDIPAGTWHTIVSLARGSAFIESKPGPYTPFEPGDFADWAPPPGTADASAYLASLVRRFDTG